MALDRDKASAAIGDRISRPLGLPLHAAARGVLAIVENNMLGAIRIVSVERGHDPRGFTLVAFGGAGPLHGCALADLLGITRVLIPPAPGVLCAEGLLGAELKAGFSRTLLRRDPVPAAEIEAAFADLTLRAMAWLAEEDVEAANRRVLRRVSLRYAGQGSELVVPWTDSIEAAEAAFVQAHRQAFGFTLEAPCELVTADVEATGSLPGPAPVSLAPDCGTAAWTTTELFLPDGPRQVPLIAREALGAGARFCGPAILTQLDSTTLVPAGWAGEVLAAGSLLLRRATAEE
jgi:N-methylhydantoinase A